MALPPCGIYRTTRPLPGREELVAAGRLVYFHNHSEQGAPLVLLPKDNTHNRWSFQSSGHLIQGDHAAAFIATLLWLPREGLYVVQEQIDTGDDESIPARSLVQVGYNPSGHAILFEAEPHGNGMSFPQRGARFEALTIFDNLAKAPFDPPTVAEAAGKAEGGGGEDEGEGEDEDEPRMLH